MLTLAAPAKLNLTLEVLGRRPDGYHEIRSVLQALSLGDTLHFRAGKGISFSCDMPGWSAEASLVSRAAKLLGEVSGSSPGASINIEKRIPLVSGLGGDSSAAAATLRGLNELWGLGLSQERLLALAAQLGSDVAFFIWGGTALAEGRGDLVTPLPPLSGVWAVLVVPDMPVLADKTKRLYEGLKPAHFTDGHITRRMVEVLRAQGEFSPSSLFNTFENVAFDIFPGLKLYKEHLLKLGAPHVRLAGSGPTLFAIFKDKSQAEDLYTRGRNQGMEVYLAGVGTHGG